MKLCACKCVLVCVCVTAYACDVVEISLEQGRHFILPASQGAFGMEREGVEGPVGQRFHLLYVHIHQNETSMDKNALIFFLSYLPLPNAIHLTPLRVCPELKKVQPVPLPPRPTLSSSSHMYSGHVTHDTTACW